MAFRFIAAMVACVLSLPVFANEPTEITKAGTWWVNLGVGASTTVGYEAKSDDDHAESDGSSRSPLFAASVNYALFDNQFIEFRGTANTNFNSGWSICYIVCLPSEEKLNAINDVGVLYGLMGKTKYVTATASIGLAYTSVDYEKQTVTYELNNNQEIVQDLKHSHEYVNTVGVPFEVSVFFTPLFFAGVGVILVGNANPEASYVGGVLALQFGKLR